MTQTKHILHLTLKKKWFDLSIHKDESLRKNEEYRAITPFWIKRLVRNNEELEPQVWDELCDCLKEPTLHFTYIQELLDSFECEFKKYDVVQAWNGGYCGGNLPNYVREFKGISIGKAKPEWSDNWQGDVFVIKLGDIISATP